MLRNLRPLLLPRFGRSHSISILLLRGLRAGRSLVAARLAIIRPLVIPLFLASGRRHCLATRLFVGTLVLPQLARLVIASHIFRPTRFTNDFVHGTRG